MDECWFLFLCCFRLVGLHCHLLLAWYDVAEKALNPGRCLPSLLGIGQHLKLQDGLAAIEANSSSNYIF